MKAKSFDSFSSTALCWPVWWGFWFLSRQTVRAAAPPAAEMARQALKRSKQSTLKKLELYFLNRRTSAKEPNERPLIRAIVEGFGAWTTDKCIIGAGLYAIA